VGLGKSTAVAVALARHPGVLGNDGMALEAAGHGFAVAAGAAGGNDES
jgi:hypothetical protein